MIRKTEKVKDESLIKSANDSHVYLESILDKVLNSEGLSKEIEHNTNYAYKINNQYVKSMVSIDVLFEKAVKANNWDNRKMSEEQKNKIRTDIRDFLLRRDLAIIEIISNNYHLEADAIEAMENAVVNAMIQHFILKKIDLLEDKSRFSTVVTEKDIDDNRERIVNEYNEYAKINGLKPLAKEQEHDIIVGCLTLEKQNTFQKNVAQFTENLYDTLIKKYSIEQNEIIKN